MSTAAFDVANRIGTNVSRGISQGLSSGALDQVLQEAMNSGDPEQVKNVISQVTRRLTPEDKDKALQILDYYTKNKQKEKQNQELRGIGVTPGAPPAVQLQQYRTADYNKRFPGGFKPQREPQEGTKRVQGLPPVKEGEILSPNGFTEEELRSQLQNPNPMISDNVKNELRELEKTKKKIAEQTKEDIRKAERDEDKAFARETEKGKERRSINDRIIEGAENAKKTIQSNKRQMEIINRGKIDNPSYAKAVDLLGDWGKKFLSEDSVAYKAGLVEGYIDLQTIFKGRTMQSEMEVYGDKIPDLYLTDKQKKAILTNRIDALQLPIIKARIAAEIEEEYPNLSALAYNQKINDRMEIEEEKLFRKVWDKEKAIYDEALVSKERPLDATKPADAELINEYRRKAGGNDKKAKSMLERDGFQVDVNPVVVKGQIEEDIANPYAADYVLEQNVPEYREAVEKIESKENPTALDQSEFEESKVMSLLRYLGSAAKGTVGGLMWKWNMLMAGMGDTLSVEEEQGLQRAAEMYGIPWNREEFRQNYDQNEALARSILPTTDNIAQTIEDYTGIPLNAVTRGQHALEFFMGARKILAGQSAPVKGIPEILQLGQRTPLTFRGVNTVLPPAVLAGGVTAAKEGMQEAGVPQPLAELGSFAILKKPTAGAGRMAFEKETKPSGLPKRRYEDIKDTKEISAAKKAQIGQKVADDFKQIAKDIVEIGETSGKTQKTLIDNPNYKQDIQQKFKDVETLSERLPTKLETKALKTEILEMTKKGHKKGVTIFEYDKEYSNFLKEFVENTPDAPMPASKMVEQYRKNNELISRKYDPERTYDYNRAKRDALLDYNRMISKTIEETYPDSEFSKVFKETNKQFSELSDYDAISNFIEGVANNEIDYEKANKFMTNENMMRPFKRALGNEVYPRFQTLMRDILSTERPFSKLRPEQKKSLGNHLTTIALLYKSPLLGGAKVTYDTANFFYKKLTQLLLDRPKYVFTWEKAVNAVKRGNFEEAVKQAKVIEGELLKATPKQQAKPVSETLEARVKPVKQKESVKTKENVKPEEPIRQGMSKQRDVLPWLSQRGQVIPKSVGKKFKAKATPVIKAKVTPFENPKEVGSSNVAVARIGMKEKKPIRLPWTSSGKTIELPYKEKTSPKTPEKKIEKLLDDMGVKDKKGIKIENEDDVMKLFEEMKTEKITEADMGIMDKIFKEADKKIMSEKTPVQRLEHYQKLKKEIVEKIKTKNAEYFRDKNKGEFEEDWKLEQKRLKEISILEMEERLVEKRIDSVEKVVKREKAEAKAVAKQEKTKLKTEKAIKEQIPKETVKKVEEKTNIIKKSDEAQIQKYESEIDLFQEGINNLREKKHNLEMEIKRLESNIDVGSKLRNSNINVTKYKKELVSKTKEYTKIKEELKDNVAKFNKYQLENKIEKDIKHQDISKEGLKRQKDYFIDKLEEILKDPENYGDKTKIDIPGDGSFIVKTNSQAINQILKMVKKNWPVQPMRAKNTTLQRPKTMKNPKYRPSEI